MKKRLSAFRYILLSLLLFIGGVLLEVRPGDTGLTIGLDQEKTIQSDPTDPDDTNSQNTDPTDLENQDQTQQALRYYYSTLEDTEQEAYNKIREAVEAEESTVTLDGITPEQLEKLYSCVYLDYPEYFWFDVNYSYRNMQTAVELIFNYNATGAEKEERQAIIESAAAEILADMPAGGTDYDKIKYVFETIVQKVDYDLSAPDNQNIYSVFGNWTSVCAGYAGATKYLLDQMGIDCISLKGTANGEAHMWNIVKCNGKYYYVDSTWGDPLYQELQGDDISGKKPGYEYLCFSEEMLARAHVPDAQFSYPSCTDNSLEYYRMQGRYMDTADQTAVEDKMKTDIDAGEKQTELQFASNDMLNQVLTQMDAIAQDMMDYMKANNKKSTGSVSWEYGQCSGVLKVYWE